MQDYIVNWIVSPGTPSWEHVPAYEFAGKYFGASWHSDGYPDNGVAFMWAGPKNQPIYCDYQTNTDGTPDISKPGFCKSTVSINVDVSMDYSYFDQNGKKVDSQSVIATVMDNKIYCYDNPRP